MNRLFYKANLKEPNLGDRAPASEDEANLISSEVEGAAGIHLPVLDIDFPARLVPSSTEGHFHLYLDSYVAWDKYLRVLEALADAGLIERGYYEVAKIRKATFVRKPGVKKEDGDSNSAQVLIDRALGFAQ